MAERLHPYMGYSGDPGEGAVLVFAHSAREAKPLAFGCLGAWFETDYIDTRVRRLRGDHAYLLTLADQDKLSAGAAHVIDDPPSCQSCNRWGTPLSADMRCADCEAEAAHG